MENYGYVFKNTWDKYLTKIVEKIKVRWLKKDKDKLKQLEIKAEQLEEKTNKARKIYCDLQNKLDDVETSIINLITNILIKKRLKFIILTMKKK